MALTYPTDGLTYPDAPGAVAAPASGAAVVETYEVDLTSQTPGALSSGANSIDGVTWTLDDSGSRFSTAELSATNGLSFVMNSLNNTPFASFSQISCAIQDLLTTPLDECVEIRIWSHMSHDATSNVKGVLLGAWDGSTRLIGSGVMYSSQHNVYAFKDGSSSVVTSALADSDVVTVTRFFPLVESGIVAHGEYSGGWPEIAALTQDDAPVNLGSTGATRLMGAINSLKLMVAPYASTTSTHRANLLHLKVEAIQ